MSMYTTELRYICETMTEEPLENFDNLKGVRRIDAIIDSSKGNIFDFDYPIFDEAYRGILEKKIIRHYYTREIGAETFGLFQLYLSDKMNEIMPYYNQLYASELLSKNINPLTNSGYYQTDNTNHMGEDVNIITGRNVDTYDTVDVDSTKREYRKDEGTGGRDRNTTVNDSEYKIDINGDVIRTPNITVDTSNTGNEDIKRNEDNIRTPNLKTETNNQETDIRTPDLKTSVVSENQTNRDSSSGTTSSSENETTRTPNLTETNSGSDTVTNKQDHKITKSQPEAGTNKSTNWIIQSDTPQGGLNNITGGSGSITSSNVGQPPQSGSSSTLYASAIQENTSYNEVKSGKTTEEYKSGDDGETQETEFGHKITNTGNEKTEGSQSDSSQTVDNEITSDSGSSTTSNTGNETRVNTGNDITLNTGNETSVSNMGQINTSSNTGKSVTSGNETKVNTGNDVTLNTGNETSVSNMGQINTSSNTGKSVTSGNETSVNTSKETKKANDNGISTTEYGKTLNQTGNDKENVTRVKGGNITKDSDNRHRIVYGSSDEYLKHLIGYMGVSQSKLLNEFRETFLNIDKMIIEDLRVLFFGLY